MNHLKSTRFRELQTIIILMIGTVLSKVLGFVRELIVAYRFGAGVISDAFVLTNGIPGILFSAIGVAISINFIPCCSKLTLDSDRDYFTSNLLNLLLIILLFGCILVCLFPRYVLIIFASGLNQETERYAIVMLRIVVFSIIPIVCTSLLQAYNQMKNEFVTTSIQGIVVNICIIIFTFLSNNDTYFILSIGLLFGNFIGMFLSIGAAYKNNFTYSFVLQPNDSTIKCLILLTIPLLAESVISNLCLLADRQFASYLDSGTISGLSYAGNLANIAGTMITSSIVTTTYPKFSKMLVSENYDSFSNEFVKYALIICYILTPVSMFMCFNAEDIVTLLFEHGEFSSSATKIVSESLICYSIGVLPMGLLAYLIRGFYVMNDTKTPVKIQVLALSSNIIMNFITVKYFLHIGIALSTSCSYFLSCVLLLFSLRRKRVIRKLSRITYNAGIAIFFSCIILVILNYYFSFLFFKYLILKIIVEGMLFFLFYGIVILILRRSVFYRIINMIKNLFKKE